MIKKKPTNRWETNDAAVWNGLKYCLNGHGKILNGLF